MPKLYALCLAIGQKCQFQRFKTKKYDNAEISLKLCASKEPCSQKLLITGQELFKTGQCEKAAQCLYKSKACTLSHNKDTRLLSKRWLFCWAWKQTQKEAEIHG
jgi:hypothetical protein